MTRIEAGKQNLLFVYYVGVVAEGFSQTFSKASLEVDRLRSKPTREAKRAFAARCSWITRVLLTFHKSDNSDPLARP